MHVRVYIYVCVWLENKRWEIADAKTYGISSPNPWRPPPSSLFACSHPLPFPFPFCTTNSSNWSTTPPGHLHTEFYQIIFSNQADQPSLIAIMGHNWEWPPSCIAASNLVTCYCSKPSISSTITTPEEGIQVKFIFISRYLKEKKLDEGKSWSIFSQLNCLPKVKMTLNLKIKFLFFHGMVVCDTWTVGQKWCLRSTWYQTEIYLRFYLVLLKWMHTKYFLHYYFAKL